MATPRPPKVVLTDGERADLERLVRAYTTGRRSPTFWPRRNYLPWTKNGFLVERAQTATTCKCIWRACRVGRPLGVTGAGHAPSAHFRTTSLSGASTVPG